MQNFLLIYSTASSQLEAEKIAGVLVRNKLAACVNIIPGINSLYFWNNKVCSETEYALLIKTEDKMYDEVEKKILDVHSYETPCVLSIPIEKVANAYSSWLIKSLSSKNDKKNE